MATRRKVFQGTLIIVSVGILLFVVYYIYVSLAISGVLDSFHTKQELIDNYNKRQSQILELKRYFNSIVPRDRQVEIEFQNDTELFRFGVSPIDTPFLAKQLLSTFCITSTSFFNRLLFRAEVTQNISTEESPYVA